MTTTIQISDETQRKLFIVMSLLEKKWEREVTYDDAIKFLLQEDIKEFDKHKFLKDVKKYQEIYIFNKEGNGPRELELREDEKEREKNVLLITCRAIPNKLSQDITINCLNAQKENFVDILNFDRTKCKKCGEYRSSLYNKNICQYLRKAFMGYLFIRIYHKYPETESLYNFADEISKKNTEIINKIIEIMHSQPILSL